MPPKSLDETITQFLGYFNAQDTTNLMTLFCADNPPNPPPPNQPHFPSVGLTDNGPQFFGSNEIAALFTQLFQSFPDIALTPLANIPDRLYSRTGPPRVAFQARITATHDQKWFPKGHAHYSPPISDIVPDRVQLTNLPACAVFTLDAANLITNWTIYFDRYRMAQQLTPADLSPASRMLASLAGRLASLR